MPSPLAFFKRRPDARIRYAACPLCESAEIAERRVADCTTHALYRPELPPEIRWMACGACGHVFTDGYFTPAAAALIFSTAQSGQHPGDDFENQRYKFAETIDWILPHVQSGNWLDVGFGNAALLFTALEYGFRPIGLDLRTEHVKQLRKLGVEAHCCELAALKLDQPCAVISMTDVLEHMPFPKAGLIAARRLLAPHGVLLLSMPNMESMVWRALDSMETNPYWGEIEHYHNFGRTRLYALLRETGFEPVRYGVNQRYRSGMQILARASV